MKLFRLLAALALFATPAAAQTYTGGAGGVNSLSTTCPTSGPSKGSVVFNSQVLINAQSGTSYTMNATDCSKLVTFNNASSIAVTLPQAGTTGFASGYFTNVESLGAGTVTITPTTSTINGAATLTLTQYQSASITTDGVNYFAQVGKGSSLTLGTGVATALANNTNSNGGFMPQPSTWVSGNCPQIGASGGLVDSGSPCGGGSIVNYTGRWLGTQSSHYGTRYWPLFVGGSIVTGGTPPGTGYSLCEPFNVPYASTISGLVVTVEATPGTTTAHGAIYADGWDATNNRHFPSGAPIVSDNNNPAITSANSPVVFTFASNPSLVTNTIYWSCAQFGDTTVRYAGLQTVTSNGAVSNYPMLVGSTATGGALTAGSFLGVYNNGTFGTWPNVSVATTWTEDGTGGRFPMFSVSIASQP